MANRLHIPNTPNAGVFVLFFVGDVLSGKGTQAKQHAHIPLSIGAWAREQREKNREFCSRYGPIMDAGHYLPDEVVLSYLRQTAPTIQEGVGKIVIDGIRTHKQAEQTPSYVARPNLSLCFDLHIDKNIARERAEKRFCEESRSDDFDFSVVETRYNLWQKNRDSTLRGFRQHGVKIIDVDSNQSVTEVSDFIDRRIRKHIDRITAEMPKTQTRPNRRKDHQKTRSLHHH